MEDHTTTTDIGLWPPPPEVMEAAADASRAAADGAEPDTYGAVLETICGVVDDSQPVEKYDGSLGVTKAFVAAHQRPVGQLQWDSGLGSIYSDPGTVSGARWCSGALISHNLFLSAGHCFDQNPGGWRVPRINGTTRPILPSEIARRMHVNFNYQVDPSGKLRKEQEFGVEALVEYRLGGLDFAIVRLAGNPGAVFGIGEVATSDAKIGDMLAIIGHPAALPKRIEAGPLSGFFDDRLLYNDIDTLGGNSGSPIWRAVSGKIIGVHTDGGCTSTGGVNSGLRVSSLRGESATVNRLDAVRPLPAGTYRAKQVSTGRFLDAHQSGGADFSAVTRPAQGDTTQRWQFTHVGDVYVMQQLSSARFLDAHETSPADFDAVTRAAQDNESQEWAAVKVPGQSSVYTLLQLSSGRYLDAYESGNNHSAVTRPAQNDNSQRWTLGALGDGVYTVRQKSTGRYLDAHQSGSADFSVVTRGAQGDDSQRWKLTNVGSVYTIKQVSSGRFLDAHQSAASDYSAVTRNAQGDNSQRWVVSYLGGASYTIRQLSTRRYLDAYESGNNYSAITRTAQSNNTQRWVIS